MSGPEKKFIGRDRFSLRDSPVFGTVAVMLFTLGIVLLPGEKLGALFLGHGGTDAKNLGNAVFRAIGVVFMILLALDLGLDVFSFSGRRRGMLLALPFIIVVINNAPLVGLATGEVEISASAGSCAIFVLNCLFVGLFEESVFRGVLFPLILRKMPNTRSGIFWSVIISSALFGALHIVNIFAGAPAAVIMQIGYSFLVGAMCAVTMLLCRNVFLCALLHGAFNFCGLIADDLGTGQVWNGINISLTAAVGVAAVLYGVFLMLKAVRTDTAEKLFTDTRADDSEKVEN